MPTGRKSGIGATALQLSGRMVYNLGGLRIKADEANGATNYVYVDETPYVTAGTADGTDGFQLGPGDEIVYPASRAKSVQSIYVIGSTTGLAVSWFCDGHEEELDLDFSDPTNGVYLLVVL